VTSTCKGAGRAPRWFPASMAPVGPAHGATSLQRAPVAT
jgi:hypothetical protein